MSQLTQVSWVDNKEYIDLSETGVLTVNRTTTELPLKMYRHTLTGSQDDLLIFDSPETEYVPMELFFDMALDDKAVDTINQIVAWKYSTGKEVDSQWYTEDAGTTTVVPMINGEALYMLPEDEVWTELRQCLDTKLLMSHEFMTSSKLPVFISSIIRICSDVVLKPRSTSGEESETMMEDIVAIDSGSMFVISVYEGEIDLIQELSELFPIKVEATAGREYVLVKCTEEMDTGMPLDRWLRETLDSIQEGDLPTMYYYPINGEDLDYNGVKSIYQTILGSEKGMKINFEVTNLSVISLRLPSYQDMTLWRKHVVEPELGDVESEQSGVEVPGIVSLYETVEVELPDMYITTNHISSSVEEANKWWKSGEGLSAYAFHYLKKTGKISFTVA